MKKSQIKFGESIGVIIIVYIIILVGLIWYNSINTSALNDLYERDERQQAYEKYEYINNLNLIHVSQRGIVDEDFDLQGLYAMANYSSGNGSLYFRSQLGFSLISVDLYNYSVLGDKFNVTETIILYNYTNAENKEKKIIYRTLIPIFDEVDEKYIIGLLKVEVPLR